MINIFFFTILFIASTVHAITAPDLNLTPGKANPSLTAEVICTSGFSTENYRNVSTATKKRVFSIYHVPYLEHKNYEVDHLISLEIGGSNDIQNLWPQPYPEAHWKDQVENYLKREMCKGHISLQEAQKEILDWYPIYQKIKGQD